MDDFNLIVGGTVHVPSSNWQFWTRIAAQGLITVGGIMLAAWFGYTNAKRVFRETQADRATRILRALLLEMAENLDNLSEATDPLIQSARKSMSGEPAVQIRLAARKFKVVKHFESVPIHREVYSTATEHIGSYTPYIGEAIVVFYGQAARCARLLERFSDFGSSSDLKELYMGFLMLEPSFMILRDAIDDVGEQFTDEVGIDATSEFDDLCNRLVDVTKDMGAYLAS